MDGRLHQILAKLVPLVDISFERVWVCAAVLLDVFTRGVLYIRRIRLLEWNGEKIRHRVTM